MTRTGADVRRVCLLSRMGGPGVGDLVQRNIFLDLLRRAYPSATLTWVLGSHLTRSPLCEVLARAHSYADEILLCPDVRDDVTPDAGGSTSPNRARQDPGDWVRFLTELSAGRFDVAVVDPRSVRLGVREAHLAGVPVRIAVPTGGPDDELITHPMRLDGGGDLHGYATALAAAVGLAGVPPPDRLVPRLPLRPESLPGWTADRPLLGIHPSCSPGWHRRWPLDRFTDVAVRAARTGATLVVLGGSDDAPEVERLCAEVRGRSPGARVHPFLGRSLNALAGMIDELDLLLGNDSGPAHLAAALGTPTVVLYGPDGEEAMWRRCYPRHVGLNKNFPCQRRDNEEPDGAGQCSLGCPCNYESPDGPYPRCLTAIGVDEVWAAVSDRLRVATG